ncbi:MAG TPA: NAD-dependent epimerase/dehydratase family protein [Candidatus Acidoferrales bacterium]|jgi:CDP-paratose 2-epimerase|nr:NAD-dependent epimerase/dehydratase family protein [Candidatus Acidoferrales bacterium]
MKILITGICGFAGSTLAETLLELCEGLGICGIDNLMRPGSESNRGRLKRLGVELFHGDVRMASDFEALPKTDWVIDAAANPSVLAGVSGAVGSRQVLEHNLASLVNVLEYSKAAGAGFILLSSSRVYSIPALASLPLRIADRAFRLDDSRALPKGVSAGGINAEFSTQAPVSLYGATKLASETVALDFGPAFGLPVWIDRCGVLAGAGQFGTPDQGIFSYWIHAHRARRPLRFIGFEGCGYQVRDAFHPRDLAALLLAQMRTARAGGRRIYTAGGGPANAMSLARLTAWCDARFGAHAPGADPRPRPYDIPWMVMDNHDAQSDFGWSPALTLTRVLEEIAAHAEGHPEWLELSGI